MPDWRRESTWIFFCSSVHSDHVQSLTPITAGCYCIILCRYSTIGLHYERSLLVIATDSTDFPNNVQVSTKEKSISEYVICPSHPIMCIFCRLRHNYWFCSWPFPPKVRHAGLRSQQSPRQVGVFGTKQKESYPKPNQMSFFFPSTVKQTEGNCSYHLPMRAHHPLLLLTSFACLYRSNSEAKVFGAPGAKFVKLLQWVLNLVCGSILVCLHQKMRKEIKVTTNSFCQVLNILQDLLLRCYRTVRFFYISDTNITKQHSLGIKTSLCAAKSPTAVDNWGWAGDLALIQDNYGWASFLHDKPCCKGKTCTFSSLLLKRKKKKKKHHLNFTGIINAKYNQILVKKKKSLRTQYSCSLTKQQGRILGHIKWPPINPRPDRDVSQRTGGHPRETKGDGAYSAAAGGAELKRRLRRTTGREKTSWYQSETTNRRCRSQTGE